MKRTTKITTRTKKSKSKEKNKVRKELRDKQKPVATLPDPAPTKDLYTFTHWSLTEDGAEFAFTTPITADTTLYAIWTLSE